MKNLIRILTVLIICIVVIPTTPVNADDTAVYDKFTGEVIADSSELLDNVSMCANCVYNRTTMMYDFSTSSTEESKISSNIFDGMITTEAVSIVAQSKSNIIVYKNGEEMENQDPWTIQSEGHYKVFSGEKFVFSFTIVKEKTGLISGYKMPEGFAIGVARRNGENVPFEFDMVDLSTDGDYEIVYKNMLTGTPYTLKVSIDNTPPAVKFIGVKDGIAKGHVKIKCDEENVTFVGYRNGVEFAVTDKLKKNGDYQIYAYDEVRNETVTSFKIKNLINVSTGVLLIIVAIAIVALVGGLLYSRKHFRIR